MPIRRPTPPDFTPLPDPPVRDPGDVGTALQAIDWALDHNPDGEIEAGTFLRRWREGDLSEWPEYVAWIGSAPPRNLRSDLIVAGVLTFAISGAIVALGVLFQVWLARGGFHG